VPYDPPTDAVKKALLGVYKEVYDSVDYVTNQKIPIRRLLNAQSQLEFWSELERKYVP
jgi:hypothetical protein